MIMITILIRMILILIITTMSGRQWRVLARMRAIRLCWLMSPLHCNAVIIVIANVISTNNAISFQYPVVLARGGHVRINIHEKLFIFILFITNHHHHHQQCHSFLCLRPAGKRPELCHCPVHISILHKLLHPYPLLSNISFLFFDIYFHILTKYFNIFLALKFPPRCCQIFPLYYSRHFLVKHLDFSLRTRLFLPGFLLYPKMLRLY